MIGFHLEGEFLSYFGFSFSDVLLLSYSIQTIAENFSPLWWGIFGQFLSSYCQLKLLFSFFIFTAHYHNLCPYYFIFEILHYFCAWLFSFRALAIVLDIACNCGRILNLTLKNVQWLFCWLYQIRIFLPFIVNANSGLHFS